MDLEAGCEFGAWLTPELIKQAKGTAEYVLLDESIDKMSVGFILFDSNDRLVLTNGRYRELYSHIAHLLEPGAYYDDISSAVARYDWLHPANAKTFEQAHNVHRGGAHRTRTDQLQHDHS